MNKQEYLDTLRAELEKQSITNIGNMIEYYDEMICDRIEEGMSEEDAVRSMTPIPEVVREAVLDKSVPSLVKDRVKMSREKAQKSGNGWLWIVLAIVGFPVWLPLLITFAVVALVVFILLWVIVGVIFIVVISIGASAVACLISALSVFGGFISVPGAILAAGTALLLGGLCVLLWKPAAGLAKFFVSEIGRFVNWIKTSIANK